MITELAVWSLMFVGSFICVSVCGVDVVRDILEEPGKSHLWTIAGLTWVLSVPNLLLAHLGWTLSGPLLSTATIGLTVVFASVILLVLALVATALLTVSLSRNPYDELQSDEAADDKYNDKHAQRILNED